MFPTATGANAAAVDAAGWLVLLASLAGTVAWYYYVVE